MAIQKSITSVYGVAATYWRIVSYTVDMQANAVDVTLHGYPSKSERDAEKSPLSAANYSFVFDDNDVSRASLYDLVKANSEFTGSADV
jgi:hypothetical protein